MIVAPLDGIVDDDGVLSSPGAVVNPSDSVVVVVVVVVFVIVVFVIVVVIVDTPASASASVVLIDTSAGSIVVDSIFSHCVIDECAA